MQVIQLGETFSANIENWAQYSVEGIVWGIDWAPFKENGSLFTRDTLVILLVYYPSQ
jgi:hypothetical protein